MPGYDAFISYSHAIDGRLAPALQTALHRLAKPWYQLRALHVFRDQANLSASPGLWPSIEAALSASRFLILLASPESARSKWVAREVDHWCRHKPRDNLLIVVSDGEIVWDDAAGDFDWNRTTPLPFSLRRVFSEEPHWVDLRWARTADHISIRNPTFRDSVADLAAPIHGRAKEDLVGEDVRQHNRFVWFRRSVLAGLLTLALVASGLALYAFDQRDTARAQRDLAELRARVATSRQFAVEATSNLGARPGLAFLQALTAFRTANTPEARSALLSALRDEPRRVALLRSMQGARSVAISPDGRLLAAGGGSEVLLWDVARRTRSDPPLQTSTADQTVLSVAFSPDGHTLATGDLQGLVEFFDMRTRQRLGTLVVAHEMVPNAFDTTVAFSPDGGILAARGTSSIALIDVRRRQRVALLEDRDFSRDLAFSPDGRLLASASESAVTLWRLPSHRPVEVIPAPSSAVGIAFSPDGRTLVIGMRDGTLRVVDRRRRRLSEPMDRLPGEILDVSFSPNGRLLVAGSHRQLLVWDWKRRRRLDGPLTLTTQREGFFLNVAFSPDSRHVASVVGDGDVTLWEPRRSQRLGTSSLLPVTVGEPLTGACAFSPDSRVVAARDNDQVVVVMDVSSRQRLLALPTGDPSGLPFGPTCAAFSHDGQLLAVRDEKGDVEVWDIKRHQRLRVLPVGDSLLEEVLTFAFSPDGRLLAVSHRLGDVFLWDIQRQQRLGPSLTAEQDDAYHLAFSPDGRLLAAAGFIGRGRAGKILLFDVQRRQRIGMLPHPSASSIAFSPDNRILASGGYDGDIVLWDVERRQRLGASLVGHDDEVRQLVFSPDRQTLASVAADRVVNLWDTAAQDPVPIGTLGRHRSPISAASFSRDGHTLLSAGGRELGIWDVDVRSWQWKACSIVRPLVQQKVSVFFPGEQDRRSQYRAACDGVPEP